MSKTLEYALDLMRRESVTPEDAGCQKMMADILSAAGFEIEFMQFGDVTNLWARRGSAKPLFCFAGHTDVVPTGPSDVWEHHPFAATVQGDTLYGRGAADMKGSLAAMLRASERFVGAHPDHSGSIAFLITSDEEGPAINGTVKVIDTLQQRNEKIDYCLVGEPSSSNKIGDVVKNGRRGSLGGELRVKGTQGHVAYPEQAENPIHNSSKVLEALLSAEWDKGNDFFPATSFQITNINSGTGATNVIPGTLDLIFNFRFSTEVTDQELQQRIEKILDDLGIDYDLEWTLFGQPFLTSTGKLLDAVSHAIKNTTGYNTELSTAGGTSDGRFIAPTGSEVVELGPTNATIHKVNENTSVTDLNTLSDIYEKILSNLLT